ncbi:MAG: LysR family transcriptional regulator [Pseudomonadota bacterium]
MIATTDLQIFVAIARAGSISRAADQLKIAKSALSRRLAELERSLGVQLIARTTRQMSLTSAGEVFLARAEQVLDDLAETEADVRAADAALTGRLRIAAPLSYGLARLQPIFTDFLKSHPDLDIEVDFSDRKVDLVGDGFDIALRIGSLPDSSLIARRVGPVDHIAAAAPAFWDQYGRPDHPGDLASLACLRYLNAPAPRTVPYTLPDGSSGTVVPDIRMLASNSDFLCGLAVEACGFLVEPDFILEPYLKDGRLEAVLPDVRWADMSLYLVYPPSRRITARTRAFSEAVAARLGGP